MAELYFLNNIQAGHLLDASGERTIFSMIEILSLSLLYGCGENINSMRLLKKTRCHRCLWNTILHFLYFPELMQKRIR